MKFQVLTIIKDQDDFELFRSQTNQPIKCHSWNVVSLKKLDSRQFNEVPLDQLTERNDLELSGLIWQIKEALKERCSVLIAAPGMIFENGSIEALVRAGSDPNSVVVFPHPRVLSSFHAEKDDNPVKKAWKNLHRSWIDAEIGCKNQNSYIGGVKWRYVKDNLIEVTHRLPFPFFCNFTEEDLDYFRCAQSFGALDHFWPGDILIPRGRMRYITSSDACFIVEVTEKDKFVPPVMKNHPTDGFWRNQLHNHINGQIQAYFRYD